LSELPKPPPNQKPICTMNDAIEAKKLAIVISITSRLAMWVSSWPSTPSSSGPETKFSSPVVTHTVEFDGERPIANAFGIVVSAIASFGIGRFACTHRRSTIPNSSGACDGETSCAPIDARASLSEVKY
jgi:hypothetical protein